jgi:phosphopantothenoylcysteine decarboxylase/phosphopantothenate--cysteine ligase
MHPSERLRGASSPLLAGKTIVLGVTGSIAAVRTVELARELLRHGARVVPVMTREATRILHPNALEFATGLKPITELTGAVEHVAYMGVGAHRADLLLVAPCTANTMSKMALGIDDSPVTTFFSTGATRVPTLIAPAMHETMGESPFLQENERRLRAVGVRFVEPKREEGKAKLAEPDEIVEEVLAMLGPRTLAGKRVLVVNGATQEPLDDMRVVSNRSSGRTGAALALHARRLGAHVEHWFGHGDLRELPPVATRRFSTVADLLALAEEAARFDAILVPAAISDYGPARAAGKIPSEKGALDVHLAPLPKVIDTLAKHARILVPFKAEAQADDAELAAKARRTLERTGARFVVANRLDAADPARRRALLVDAASAQTIEGTNDALADAILARLARELSG